MYIDIDKLANVKIDILKNKGLANAEIKMITIKFKIVRNLKVTHRLIKQKPN